MGNTTVDQNGDLGGASLPFGRRIHSSGLFFSTRMWRASVYSEFLPMADVVVALESPPKFLDFFSSSSAPHLSTIRICVVQDLVGESTSSGVGVARA